MAPRKAARFISPEDWSAKLGIDLANKVFQALLQERETVGEDNYRMAYSMFLSGIISAFVSVGLRQKPQDESLYSQEEIVKFAENNFGTIKTLLQTSVANGVQSGIMTWSGQEIEYYVLIKPTPDPINSKPC